MNDLITCSSCGEEVYADSDYCPHCGGINNVPPGLACVNHTVREVSGVCIICRNPFCEECLIVISGRKFCEEHHQVEVAQDWAKVFESTEVHEAEFVRSLLESNAYKVLVQNFQSIGFMWYGGESPLSREQIGRPAKVFVPIPEFLSALKTIVDWQKSEIEMK